MPVDHTCYDGCFDKRAAAKQTLNCFLCGHECNLRCYHITNDFVIKLISSNTNVIFVCTDCQRKPKKKEKRMSNVGALSLTPALSINGSTPSITSSFNHNDRTDNDNQLITSGDTFALLREINDRLAKIENNNDKMHDTLKINHDQIIDRNESNEKFTQNLDIITRELFRQSKLLDNVATTEQLKISTTNICSSIQKKTNPKLCDSGNSRKSQQLFRTIVANKTEVDTLELSFSNDISVINDSIDGRPSIAVTQTVDDSILEMMQRSDSTTWKTFDIIRNEMKQQHETTISHLMAMKNSFDEIKIYTPTNHSSNANDVRSPLIDSIIQDTMEKILNEIIDIKGSKFTSTLPQDVIDPHDIITQITRNIDFNSHSSLPLPLSNNDHETTQFLSNTLLNEELQNGCGGGRNIRKHNDQIDSTIASFEPNESIPITQSRINTDTCTQQNFANGALHEFHLSKLHNQTTTNMIYEYMKSKGIDTSATRVIPLFSKHRDISTLSFVSFKIDTNETIALIISQRDFWPPNSMLNPFQHRQRSTARIVNNTQHFLETARMPITIT